VSGEQTTPPGGSHKKGGECAVAAREQSRRHTWRDAVSEPGFWIQTIKPNRRIVPSAAAPGGSSVLYYS